MVIVTIRRINGVLKMTLDAEEFHTYLRSIGATTRMDSNGQEYYYSPVLSTLRNVDDYNGRVSHGYLLYKGPQVVDMPTRISSLAKLKEVAAGLKDVCQGIIEAFRPVDVTIRVVAKKPEVPAQIVTPSPAPS